eukprot:g7392.t1
MPWWEITAIDSGAVKFTLPGTEMSAVGNADFRARQARRRGHKGDGPYEYESSSFPTSPAGYDQFSWPPPAPGLSPYNYDSYDRYEKHLDRYDRYDRYEHDRYYRENEHDYHRYEQDRYQKYENSRMPQAPLSPAFNDWRTHDDWSANPHLFDAFDDANDALFLAAKHNEPNVAKASGTCIESISFD